MSEITGTSLIPSLPIGPLAVPPEYAKTRIQTLRKKEIQLLDTAISIVSAGMGLTAFQLVLEGLHRLDTSALLVSLIGGIFFTVRCDVHSRAIEKIERRRTRRRSGSFYTGLNRQDPAFARNRSKS